MVVVHGALTAAYRREELKPAGISQEKSPGAIDDIVAPSSKCPDWLTVNERIRSACADDAAVALTIITQTCTAEVTRFITKNLVLESIVSREKKYAF